MHGVAHAPDFSAVQCAAVCLGVCGARCRWLLLGLSPCLVVAHFEWAAGMGSPWLSSVASMLTVGCSGYACRLFRARSPGIGKRRQDFFLGLFLVWVWFSLDVDETFN